MQDQRNLIWIDLEMTGLEPETDCIIEIATIITDQQLNIIAEGPMLAIHQPDQVLNQMNEWCIKQHGESGLTHRVQQSRLTARDAELETLQFLQQYVPKSVSPMCGNSICQDRRFLAREMPELESYFHYRNLDVSSLKEMAKRWYPKSFSGQNPDIPEFSKLSKHLALDDIKDSINELIYYKKYFLKNLPD